MMTATLTGSRWLMVPAVCRRECLLTFATEGDAYPPGLARDMAALLSPLPREQFTWAWTELIDAVHEGAAIEQTMVLDALVGES